MVERDFIVVGAGPAGCSCARQLSVAGIGSVVSHALCAAGTLVSIALVAIGRVRAMPGTVLAPGRAVDLRHVDPLAIGRAARTLGDGEASEVPAAGLALTIVSRAV